MEVYYKNHLGQVIDFSKLPYRMLKDTDLFNYEWSYESRNVAKPKIRRFYRGLSKHTVKITVRAGSQEEYEELVENLMYITGVDIQDKSQGRLYVNGQYLPCYFISSKKDKWNNGARILVNEYTVISETGTWVKEKYNSYKAGDAVTTDNRKYIYRYPYRYASGLNSTYINNEHFAPCDFKMLIYGECANPHVIIGGRKYQLYLALEAGEYVVVDSKASTVKKTMTDGTVVNMFHCRETRPSVFEKIRPGRNEVRWPGNFDFEITLYEERSEPRWLQ